MERIDPVHSGHFEVSGKTRWFGPRVCAIYAGRELPVNQYG